MSSKNPIPRLSSSLILLRPHKSPHSMYNYQVLLLRRNRNTSFSNMYAFPGGLFDDSKDFPPENSSLPLRTAALQHTAYRETLEETGLCFFSKNSCDFSQELSAIRAEFKEKSLEWHAYSVLKSRFSGFCHENIDPLIRLITIPHLNPRYDTQFFLHRVENHKILNWRSFFEGKSFAEATEQWDLINYDTNEFSDLLWLTPLEAVKKHYEENLGLAPPQFIILNILSSFTDVRHLEAFVQSVNRGKNREIHGKKNSTNPCIFPNMLCLRNTEDVDKTREKDYKYVALGNSDAKYPIKFVVAGEKQENLKAELLESFTNLQGNQRKVRIFFKEMRKMFEKHYDVDISLPQLDPLNFLKGFKEISSLYRDFQ